MKVEVFDKYEFFAGVPDSLLAPLCGWLYDVKELGRNHVVAANEGNAVAVAAGYYLATGKIPLVYLQNSGLGNIANPVVSLTNPKVYGIPMLFVVGWRGEPGLKDEPQHIFQGEITENFLDCIGIEYFVIDKNTSEEEFYRTEEHFAELFKSGKSAAYIIKKDALHYKAQKIHANDYSIVREDAICEILKMAENDVVVATTGKIAREVYEIRKKLGQNSDGDFLTVGSMGHSSSVALGIALNQPNSHVWVLDGDGAALMHMGAMAVIGKYTPKNLTHIILNNAAHESVGGMPTVADGLNFGKIALACGYDTALTITNIDDLRACLMKMTKQTKMPKQLNFLEIKTSISSRADLGRPTETPQENRAKFMEFLKNKIVS
ncbi:MAG: phosphonopyruvate decarboxylase [Turicibacter sp.]|nr:phosphonopyruvate decarboxylase [Turicibacter sp.]